MPNAKQRIQLINNISPRVYAKKIVNNLMFLAVKVILEDILKSKYFIIIILIRFYLLIKNISIKLVNKNVRLIAIVLSLSEVYVIIGKP